jgi:IS4 transposase
VSGKSARIPARYPDKLGRVTVRDTDRGRTLVLLTNQFGLPAPTIAELYRSRWQIELFFKWIKQHPRIKRFIGVSENAVKTQIWIAVAVYVPIAIVIKRLALEAKEGPNGTPTDDYHAADNLRKRGGARRHHHRRPRPAHRQAKNRGLCWRDGLHGPVTEAA